MIKAIETHYKSYRFRSRLEARWAVFFERLGLKWEYEPEGFDLSCYQPLGYKLSSYAYLPDFWLPGLGLYVEIKGSEPTDEEIAKCNLLADHTQRATLLVFGLPYENPGYLSCWDVTDSSAGRYERWATVLFHEPKLSVILHDDERAGRGDRDLYFRNFEDHVENLSVLPFYRVKHPAADAAKAARFEHGEKP